MNLTKQDLLRIAEAFITVEDLEIGQVSVNKEDSDRWPYTEFYGVDIACRDENQGVVWFAPEPRQLRMYHGQQLDVLNAICEAYGTEKRFAYRKDTKQIYWGDELIEDPDDWMQLAGPLGMQALLAARQARLQDDE